MILNIECCENLEHEYKTVFYASLLHKHGIINDAKLRGIFKSLRDRKSKNDTSWYVNTYHSNINDKWYGDMFMSDILKSILDAQMNSLELNEFIKYVNIYLNKAHNYCVYFIFFNYVKESINRNRSYRGDYDSVNKYFNTNFVITKKEEYSCNYSFSYCCEDCDGDYDDYMDNQYEHYVLDNVEEEIEKHFRTEYNNSLKNFKHVCMYKDFSL